MKKRVKYVIAICVLILIVIASIILLNNFFHDENRLSQEEKKWINNNLSTVNNVNMINDLNVFGENGKGLFYDFLKDLSDSYGMKLNPVTYNGSENTVDNGFVSTNTVDEKLVVFYEDDFVLVKKDYELIIDEKKLSNKKIGILDSDKDYLNTYLKNTSIEYQVYETKNQLLEAFSGELEYILVPKYEYVNTIIQKNYNIIYHFSDIKKYYGYRMQNTHFSSVLKKYFSKWQNKKMEKSFNESLKNTLIKNLGLSEVEVKELTSKVYNYGFVNNNPYEILIGGNYGGIVSVYLKRFSDMANVDFKYTKYRTYKMLTNAINNNSVDIYFNYYNLTNNFVDANTLMNINYYVVAKNNEKIIVNSIESLQDYTVYVQQDSILYDYLKTIENITINTYKTFKDIKKNNGSIIVLDSETYLDSSKNELKDYNLRYSGVINNTYNFKVKDNNSFYRLFKTYVNLLDPKEVKISGLYNYNKTLKNGTILSTLAKYILYILVIFVLVVYFLYRKAKKVKISKKIKRIEKIRYIDQLTSLKNRNYLNENITAWNKNTIYPQTMIVVDLNKVQEINDTLGYENGDKQIKAAANILVRTQLDNSDVIRTDGNEFLIYLVGYDERQIVSYIKKLTKEFKNLPYEFGASIGHSMILDDLKSIEDAINEAVEDMKNKKNDMNNKE